MIVSRATLLVAGCVLFGAVILVELYGGADDDAPRAAVSPRADNAAAVQRPRPARLDDLLASILARPLFNPTRRPSETAPDIGAPAAELTDKRLAGIVIEPDRRFAIFAVAGAKPLTLTEGESVDGWRIENIAPTNISLSSPSGTKTLQPKMDANLVRQSRTQFAVNPSPGGPSQPGRLAPAPAAPQRPIAPGPAAAIQGPAVDPMRPPGVIPPRSPLRPGQH